MAPLGRAAAGHCAQPSPRQQTDGLVGATAQRIVTVEVLKAIRTYHLAYRAVFRSAPQDRLPLVRAPALVIADSDDPLAAGADEAVRLLAQGRLCAVAGGSTPEGRRAKFAAIRAFLDEPGP